MNALHMLDVTIGLIVVFLLVSLICTALNEWIEGLIKRRAADLARGIKELLQDPKGEGLTRTLYSHPLINGLYKSNYDSNKNLNLPSYIPSRNFALALYDIVSRADAAPAAPGSLADQIDKDQLSKMKQVLSTLKITSGENVDKTIKSIEDWYNGSMDTVSGWYKRRVQRILIFLGFIVSFIMNIDTIAIFKSLNNDPAIRNSLVAAAQEFAKCPPPCNQADTGAMARVEMNSQKLRELRLPVGWNWQPPKDPDPSYVTNYYLAIPQDRVAWIFKILGLLITAMAVSLGASFWFDMLNRIMVVRSTVKPKEKSPDEPAVDR